MIGVWNGLDASVVSGANVPPTVICTIEFGHSEGFVFETISNQCGECRAFSMATVLSRLPLVMSATISVHPENLGGEHTQPIGFMSGIPTNDDSFSRVGKRTLR